MECELITLQEEKTHTVSTPDHRHYKKVIKEINLFHISVKSKPKQCW